MASSERPLLGKGSGQRGSCASDVLRAITKAQYYQLFVVLQVRIELTTSPLLGSCLSLIVASVRQRRGKQQDSVVAQMKIRTRHR